MWGTTNTVWKGYIDLRRSFEVMLPICWMECNNFTTAEKIIIEISNHSDGDPCSPCLHKLDTVARPPIDFSRNLLSNISAK